MVALAQAKTLRDTELVPLAKEIRRMADSINDPKTPDKKEFNAEEQAKWEKVNADYEACRKRVDILERAEKTAGYMDEPAGGDRLPPGRQDFNGKTAAEAETGEERKAPTDEDRGLALQAWCRSQLGVRINKRHREACKRVRVSPRAENYRVSFSQVPYHRIRKDWWEGKLESRALSVTQFTGGGATVPEGFVQNLEEALLQYGGIRQVASVLRTTSGNDLPWPTVNDTTNKGVRLSENTTVTTQDIPFGQVVLHAWKYTSKLVQVPVELLEDSAFDLSSFLGRALGIRIGRIQSDEDTTGTGASQPNGIVTAATLGATGGSTTAILGDDLYSLKHAVDPEYRKGPGVGYMMHDKVLLVIKKLKDGMGRYLWQASLAGKAPDTIDGDPVYINQSMVSTVASANKTVLYGDLSKYMIRDVSEFRLRKLVERYADADQVGFVAFTRHDANLLDAGTHPVQYLTH